MKKLLLLFLTLLFSLTVFANNNTPIKVIVKYEKQKILYPGQKMTCTIFLLNKNPLFDYELIKKNKVYKIEGDSISVTFLASRWGKEKNQYGQIAIKNFFKIREYSNEHDRTTKFQDFYYINWPAHVYVNNDSTLYAYKKIINEFSMIYPFYPEEYFKAKETHLGIKGATTLNVTNSKIVFIPHDTTSESFLKIACGGNPITKFRVICLDIPTPEIHFKSPILTLKYHPNLNIEDYKITKGKVLLIRGNSIVQNLPIQKIQKLKSQKNDTVLITINEVNLIQKEHSVKLATSYSKSFSIE